MDADKPLRRWSEAGADARPIEQQMGKLILRAGASFALPPQTLETTFQKLRVDLAQPRSWRVRTALLLAAGVAIALAALFLWPNTTVLRPPPPVASRGPSAPQLPTPTISHLVIAASEPASEPVFHKPEPRAKRALSQKLLLAPQDEEDSLSAESRLIAQAVEHLRRKKDFAAALLTLDRYDARFEATGALRREAKVTRVEALFASGARQEALMYLEKIELEGMPRAQELRVLHGELLAEAGGCSRAVSLFGQVIDAGADSMVEERALYGRAMCRARLDDFEGSRGDLSTYLQRYPTGRFAGGARDALQE